MQTQKHRPLILEKEVESIRKAENALLEAQYRLAKLLSSSPSVIYCFNAKGKNEPTFISDNFTDVLGYDRNEYLENIDFWEECIHPDDKESVMSSMQRLWKEGRLTHEYRFRKKDGTYLWLNDDMKLLRDENNKPREVVGSWSDIEERKKAEHQLVQAQERLDHIMLTSPSVVYSFEANDDRKPTYISRNIKNLLGYEPREYLENPKFWIERVHPEDLERITSHVSTLYDVGKLSIDYRFQKKDQSYCWINDELTLQRNEMGEPVEVIGTWSDITANTMVGEALVTAQNRLSHLMTFTPAVIYSFDATGENNATFVSENIIELLGYKPKEYLKNRDFWVKRVHPDDKKQVLNEFSKLWESGRYDQEYRFKKKSGEYIWLSDQMRTVNDPSGVAKEVVGAWTDIDNRKKMEEALSIAMDKAVNANNAKTKFMSRISHEFRTPLNAIIGITEMLIEDLDTAQSLSLDEPLSRIHRSGKHLLSLINEFLDISKIEAGKINLNLEKFELAELIEDVITMVKPMLDSNNNSFDCSDLSGMQNIESDKKRVLQILLNLLSNAAKFTKNGNVTLNIRATKDNNLQVICFDVIDTGTGIPQDQLNNIFDEYSQIKSSSSSKFAGTGLGLDISRKLAQILGGDITVISDAGQGATFTLKLPLTPPKSDNQPD
jgi:PAS domain S-box-containing protein